LSACGRKSPPRWSRCRSSQTSFVDPKLMATLLLLRQGLRGDLRVPTAENMLGDMTMMSYQNAIRVHGWIGDLMLRIEHEFFGDDAFTELAREGWRRQRFSVEDRVRRLSEQLLPVLDRLNRCASTTSDVCVYP